MSGGMTGVETLVGAVLLTAGLILLNLSWRRRKGVKTHLRLGGWLLVVGGFVGLARAWGAELGITFAALAISCIAYVIVALGVELRRNRQREPRDIALEPEERATNWRRAVAKSLLAIVLAGIASIGIGVAFAVIAPMAAYDRIMLGGLLVPVLWGGGMAWTLSDARLLRATIVLGTVSAISYAIAFLPKAFG